MLFAFAFLAVNNLDVKKARKSSRIALHGAVRVPSRALRLFAALLAQMRRALIGRFSQSSYNESVRGAVLALR